MTTVPHAQIVGNNCHTDPADPDEGVLTDAPLHRLAPADAYATRISGHLVRHAHLDIETSVVVVERCEPIVRALFERGVSSHTCAAILARMARLDVAMPAEPTIVEMPVTRFIERGVERRPRSLERVSRTRKSSCMRVRKVTSSISTNDSEPPAATC